MSKLLKIKFSQHARKQLEERSITEKEIVTACRKPNKIIAQTESRLRVLRVSKKGRKNYLLVIVYDKTNSSIEIVTAFYTSKVKKYL